MSEPTEVAHDSLKVLGNGTNGVGNGVLHAEEKKDDTPNGKEVSESVGEVEAVVEGELDQGEESDDYEVDDEAGFLCWCCAEVLALISPVGR